MRCFHQVWRCRSILFNPLLLLLLLVLWNTLSVRALEAKIKTIHHSNRFRIISIWMCRMPIIAEALTTFRTSIQRWALLSGLKINQLSEGGVRLCLSFLISLEHKLMDLICLLLNHFDEFGWRTIGVVTNWRLILRDWEVVFWCFWSLFIRFFFFHLFLNACLSTLASKFCFQCLSWPQRCL